METPELPKKNIFKHDNRKDLEFFFTEGLDEDDELFPEDLAGTTPRIESQWKLSKPDYTRDRGYDF